MPYELAIGLNGKTWVKGRSLEETLVICNLIQSGESMPEHMMDKYVTKSVNKLLGVRQ